MFLLLLFISQQKCTDLFECIPLKVRKNKGSYNLESYAYNSSQPTSKRKLPSSFVHRSRVQRIIDDFLYKAKKRGLYNRTGKEKRHCSDANNCHSVSNSQPVDSVHSKESNQNFRDHSPPKMDESFAFKPVDLSDDLFDHDLHHTHSSGFHSRSNSPDPFEQQRNQNNSEILSNYGFAIQDDNKMKEKEFMIFENPCDVHLLDCNSNRRIQTLNSPPRDYLLHPRFMQNPFDEERKLHNIPENKKLNFTDITKKFGRSQTKSSAPLNYTKPCFFSQQPTSYHHQLNKEINDKAFETFDVGICERCNKLYNKCITHNDEQDYAFIDEHQTSHGSTKIPLSSYKPSRDIWVPNFSSQPSHSNNMNFCTNKENDRALQQFRNDYQLRHFDNTDPDQLIDLHHCNCCIHKYFTNSSHSQIAQTNFHKYMNHFLRDHFHSSFKDQNPQKAFSNSNTDDGLKRVDPIYNHMNKTYTIEAPCQSFNPERFYQNERHSNDFSGKNDQHSPFIDHHIKYNVESTHENVIHSPDMPYFQEDEAISKPKKTSKISDQTYKEDGRCEHISCIHLRKQDSTKIPCCTDGRKAMENEKSQQKQSSSLKEKRSLHDETILASDWNADRRLLTPTANQLPKALATSTPFIQSIDDDRKFERKITQRPKVFYSFQERKTDETSNDDNMMSNGDETESTLTTHLLREAGKSISLETIGCIENEE
ncbi:unnamed protein product [Trichobilharzia szidati]|nr:unnamed protein product [Trichobilharzia szidati]